MDRLDAASTGTVAAPAVHTAGPVIDLHLDSLLWTRLVGYDLRKRHRNWLPRSPYGFHSDLPRMQEGGVSGAFFGLHAWPFCAERAFPEVVRQIETFHDLVERDTRLRYGDRAEDFVRGHAEGVIVGCLGVEGAHVLNGHLDRVERLYHAGVRYMTLAHFSRNHAATPAMGAGSNQEDGLTAFGRELIHEMNRVGMIVDCAHLNDVGRIEAAECSSRPVMVTHTGVKAVVDHRRNVSDASIQAVARSGGIVGIMFAPIFTSGRLLGGIDDVIAHVRHVIELVGPEHVAIGTDYDGFIPTVPKEVEDIAQLPRFTAHLLAAGVGEDVARRVLGGNVLAFLERHARAGAGAQSPSSSQPEGGNTVEEAGVS